jgi:type I restriction enzyme, S subunit
LDSQANCYYPRDNRLISTCDQAVVEDRPEGGRLLFKRGRSTFSARQHHRLCPGIAAIYHGPEQTYIYPDLMIRVRIRDRIVARWVWRVANSFIGRMYMQTNAIGTTGRMPKINGETLCNLVVPLPPRSEIVEMLRSVVEGFATAADVEDAVGAVGRDATALRQSILKAAFEGRLVPQDPADEPASALLARLRTNNPPQTRSRGRWRQLRMAL